MKYIVLLCDGMSDVPSALLQGKTPMEAAKKPNMDRLAAQSEVGMVSTIPSGMPPGSDVANLSVLGYDPRKDYTGRSPLEAASIGIKLETDDLALRCNLVTLSGSGAYEDFIMADYCAGDINTAQALQLIQTLDRHLSDSVTRFYGGVFYRHCLVKKNWYAEIPNLTPPHDISGKKIQEYLPEPGQAFFFLMTESYRILKDHPVNKARVAKGLPPANSIWLWGAGRKPVLAQFQNKFGISGTIISAVDLLKGIGICAGMQVKPVAGATGYIDTNFEGKADAALEALAGGQDLVYIHVEAPDECGHRGEYRNKVRAIEYIDRRLLSRLLNGLCAFDDYKLLILPDHPTPLDLKTHTSDPVPFLLFHNKSATRGVSCFTEKNAESTGIRLQNATELIPYLLRK